VGEDIQRPLYCSFSSAISALEPGGVDDWRSFEMGSGLMGEPCGTPLLSGSGRVRASGADCLRGRSLKTERDSGASVHKGVVGALAWPVREQEDRGVSLMEIDGGKIPIFWLVASWMVRSNSLTSSIVMSGLGKDQLRPMRGRIVKVDLFDSLWSIAKHQKVKTVTFHNFKSFLKPQARPEKKTQQSQNDA